jgi:hypothetical protein
MTDDFLQRGWQSFLKSTTNADEFDAEQIEDMRLCFIAGATHLYRLIIDTPDEQFDARAASINREINAFLIEKGGRRHMQ